MRICDSWCEHIECNEIRRNCIHPIEIQHLFDWSLDEKHKLRIFGKCGNCGMYCTTTIKRSKEMQKAMEHFESQRALIT